MSKGKKLIRKFSLNWFFVLSKVDFKKMQQEYLIKKNSNTKMQLL